MKKLLVFCLFACFPLLANASFFGPSGKDDDCTTKASFAWCVMDLAGVSNGINDSKPGTMPVAYTGNPGGSPSMIDNIGNSAIAIAGVSDLAKMSNYSTAGRFGGGLNLLFALRASTELEPGSYKEAIAILPESEPNPDQTIILAMMESVKQMLGAEKMELVQTSHPALQPSWKAHYKFTGGEFCSSHDCVASQFNIRQKISNTKKFSTPFWMEKEIGVVENAISYASFFPAVGIDGKKMAPEWIAYNLIKYMPEWIYLYTPPSENKQVATVVSKNKELFFIKPTKLE